MKNAEEVFKVLRSAEIPFFLSGYRVDHAACLQEAADEIAVNSVFEQFQSKIDVNIPDIHNELLSPSIASMPMKTLYIAQMMCSMCQHNYK